MDEDIDAVLSAAKQIRIRRPHGLLNPLSSLPEPKAKIKASLKERMRQLAGAYIALAGFVEDDDIRYVERHPKSARARTIYRKVLEDLEQAQQEMTRFRVITLVQAKKPEKE